MAIQHGQVAIVLTNGGAVMAPWGGRDKLLGNTPLAVGVPAGEEVPVILDSAQTVVAHGKLSYAKAKGAKTVPAGWALDRDGRPTEDIDEALEGLLVPIGAYKGYGMAFVFDAICGLLLQAGVGEAIRTDQHPGPGPGHLFVTLDVAFFGSVRDFQERMDARIRQLHASAKAPGVEHIYLPGELEDQTRRHRQRDGIPLPADLVRDLDALASSVGIPTLSVRKG
jgi:LDH2 family malate/lactate/ureidoglycolate dehydrogenase